MPPGRTLRKRSRTQIFSPYTHGLSSTAISVPSLISSLSPTLTTYRRSPSSPVNFPISDHQPASPFGTPPKAKGKQEDPLGTRARGRKRGKDGQEIWPVHLEEAFLQGLVEYEDINPPCDELGVDKRRWEHRNHWLSDYILQRTGALRRRKQVGSRMQTLKRSWKCTARYYLVCSPCERPMAMELKVKLESSHQSISDASSDVPTPAGSLTASALSAQHSGDACSVFTLRPTHAPASFSPNFGSPPRPHQLAFLLWDGMRHLCLLRHSDLLPSSTESPIGPEHSAFTSLATPHPVMIKAPTERLASELCLPFGGQYYPSGSGVVTSVFVHVDSPPLHRSEHYLDGRDSGRVKVDFANSVIRILCMEDFLEDRFRCPGTEGEVLTIVAEVVDNVSSPQRQLIQVLLFQFQAVQPATRIGSNTPPLSSSVATHSTNIHDLAISSLTGSMSQEHLTLCTAGSYPLRSDPLLPWESAPTSPSSVSATSLGDVSLTTNLALVGKFSSPGGHLPTSCSQSGQQIDTLMEMNTDLSYINNSPYLHPELPASSFEWRD